MSRMDVLTESEIQEINSKSKLVEKYSELIDRESAYEMLNKKIAILEDETAKLEEQKEVEKTTKTKTTQEKNATDKIGKSVLKVLTSATFIRGAFGILSKMLKK
jgi:predicted  nucleic acid-binding Zn-ribbon protein